MTLFKILSKGANTPWWMWCFQFYSFPDANSKAQSLDITINYMLKKKIYLSLKICTVVRMRKNFQRKHVLEEHQVSL